MYADAYLAQTDVPYSAACIRRIPFHRSPQTPSMTKGSLRSPCSPQDTSRWHSQRQTPAPVKISRKAQQMMTVSTLFVIQFFFFFVLSNKVYLNPLQTLQCLQGQYSHTETFLTNFPCSKVRAGRTGGAGDSAGVVVLLRPRGGCVAGKIPAVWASASSGIFSAVLAESLQP